MRYKDLEEYILEGKKIRRKKWDFRFYTKYYPNNKPKKLCKFEIDFE